LNDRELRTNPERSVVRAMLREPLVHFLFIGAALFAFTAVSDSGANQEIRIAAAEVAQLAAYWEAQAQRKPTRAELQGLIDERIDEEILAREAVRLGLEQDDVIVRRRLAQKMAFISEDLTVVAEPTDAELRGYFEANRSAYVSPDLYAFRHVFFSPATRGDEAQRDAEQSLQRLAQGADANTIGDPFMLQREFADISQADLARDFGPAFANALPAATLGAWSGPVASAFGFHLVRVESRVSAVATQFDQVRDRVREDYVAQRRKDANAAERRALRNRYRVVIESADATSGA
jgi:peptidyl-prolyl cis-trans isomerase C